MGPVIHSLHVDRFVINFMFNSSENVALIIAKFIDVSDIYSEFPATPEPNLVELKIIPFPYGASYLLSDFASTRLPNVYSCNRIDAKTAGVFTFYAVFTLV